MHKNYYYQFAILLLFTLGLYSCSKTFSDDSPLPITYYPSVIIPTQNKTIYSLNAQTGLKNWEYKTDFEVRYTPTIAFDSLAYFANASTLYALNVKTGKIKWQKEYFGSIRSNHYFFKDKLYITLLASTNRDSIFQLDKDGAITWRNSIPTESRSAPIIANNLLYVTGQDKKVYCFNPFGANGNPTVWTYTALDVIDKSLTFAKGYLYALAGNNQLIKIDAATGTPIWPYNFNSVVKSSPIVYSDMVFVGSDNFKIYCIDAQSGNTIGRWTYATNDRIEGSACINTATENVLIGSNDFNLYAINHVTGKLRWKYPTGSIVNMSPVDYNGNVLFTSLDNYCYCVNATSGKLVWKYNLNAKATASPVVCTYTGSNYYPAESGNSIY